MVLRLSGGLHCVKKDFKIGNCVWFGYQVTIFYSIIKFFTKL